MSGKEGGVEERAGRRREYYVHVQRMKYTNTGSNVREKEGEHWVCLVGVIGSRMIILMLLLLLLPHSLNKKNIINFFLLPVFSFSVII